MSLVELYPAGGEIDAVRKSTGRSNVASNTIETADDAAPVLHGAEATAEEEQGRPAARGVDGVEPSVCGRNGELS